MIPITFTVADGATVSDAIDIRDYADRLMVTRENAICAIETPATLEATAITIKMSADGVTYKPLVRVDGNSADPAVAVNQLVMLPPANYPVLLPFIQLTLNSAAVGASRSITMWLREI